MRHTVTFFNLGILLAALIGLNGNTNVNLDQFVQKKFLADTKQIEYNAQAPQNDEDYAEKIDELNITLHPGTDYAPDSKSSPSSLKHCKSLVYRTLKSLPPEPVGKLKHLTLYFSESGRRGLGGGSTIILRCRNVEDEELVGVLVHEMGHIMDTGVMEGTADAGESAFRDGGNPVNNDDPSLDFYTLDFENEKTLKEDATAWDFVSGYAMADPYEDFAESYAYYILHGNEFREIAKFNQVLQAKYDYLKNRVFNGKEYFNGSKGKTEAFLRHYDVTVLPYDMNKFFVI